MYNVLEANGCQVLLVNARHVKAVPGRKTDAKDCEWLADLLAVGLLRGSVIPDQAQRDLRDPTRTRRTLVDERSAVVQRLQIMLEDANLNLAGVASDITGVSGRAILTALVDRATDPAALASAYHCLAARRAKKLATVTIGHAILRISYSVLAYGTPSAPPKRGTTARSSGSGSASGLFGSCTRSALK